VTDWAQLVRPSLHGLQPYHPGASVAELEEHYGREVVRLNRNEDLFGPFPGALVVLGLGGGQDRGEHLGPVMGEQGADDVVHGGVDDALADGGAALKRAKLQVLSGAFAGREVELSKALTTLGRPGVQVAAITRRAEAYYIVHVDSGKVDDFPLLNGTPIGAQATRLSDNDVIQLAGVKMGFFES